MAEWRGTEVIWQLEINSDFVCHSYYTSFMIMNSPESPRVTFWANFHKSVNTKSSPTSARYNCSCHVKLHLLGTARFSREKERLYGGGEV